MIAIFLSGILTAMYGIVALFFLRFWRHTRDRLFLFFSGAFAILAAQRVLLAAYAEMDALYLLRLLAFALIIIAIADKNRQSTKLT